MSAYVIFFVDEISDEDRLATYRAAAHPTVRESGGRVIVGYDKHEVVEGDPMVGVVMIEFPTYEAAQAWYHSPRYTEAAAIRKSGSKCRAVIVNGRA